MDDGTVFHSEVLREMLNKWHVDSFFRVTYWSSGNGIMESHHRTIKSMVGRGHISLVEVIIWYNISARLG